MLYFDTLFSTLQLSKLGERSKELNFNVIGACKDMLHMRSVVHKLMMKCQKIATNMEYIVSELTGRSFQYGVHCQ